MTNEKTNPMPYRAAAGAAEAAGPDMAAPVITPDDVARGTELLRRYKDGKRALEARIIADEQWYRLRHWQYLRDRRREQGGDVVEPTSAWLFNAIVSKHADAMDSFPEAVILPRSEQDEPDAKALSAIVPAVLEKTHFEQVWSDAWWYKLKHGCAAYGVFWDSAGSNGLGDVAVRQLDLLNLFWEPGITDIQASRNLFVCALMDNDDISAAWPDARPGSCGVELAQYLYDDAVDTSNKSIVVDWYYKKPLPGGGTALHLIKFTGRDLLYASENDPAMAGGFYPHGQYPVVFDVLYPEAGTPCGFGMIAVSKDPQQYIDRLSGNLLEMSMKASTPRFWVKKGCGVNAQEFLDWSKPLVEVEGSIDDERLRQISLYNLDGQWVNMLQLKIDELKETSNSRDVTQGSVSGGVTAASAIAALQEAGSKSSRDTLRASYRAFERVVELVIELIRAYYTETRPFRVAAPGAQGYAFCTYSNAGLQARTVGMDADGMALLRAPAFDVSVHAQKESPYATASQNELARQLYQLGVFNPAFAQQAGPDYWAHKGIDYCVRNRLMSGVGAGTFSPDTACTRAQIVKILYNLSGNQTDYSYYYLPFTDVAPGAWYYNAVAWAYCNDVTSGTSATTFTPNAAITRQQLVTFLYRYTVKYAPEFTGNAAPISAFPDAGSVANWAYAAMSWAVGNGLIKGNAHDNGLDYLDPNGSATRAQTATIIMRYCQLIGA